MSKIMDNDHSLYKYSGFFLSMIDPFLDRIMFHIREEEGVNYIEIFMDETLRLRKAFSIPSSFSARELTDILKEEVL